MQTNAGVELAVRVIPRAQKTIVAGVRDNSLLIRVAAPPVEGAANDAVIACLAALLHVPRRAVRIVSCARGRRKRVAIDGARVEDVARACGVNAS